MNTSKTTPIYKCVFFLKDVKDHSLLRPGTKLYGEFVRESGTFFVSPYSPPSECVSLKGIIDNDARPENIKPGHIVISHMNNSLVAMTAIRSKKIQMPVQIVYKSAIYSRTPFLASEMELLWKKTVTIFGMGTGGSELALELARAGVGHLRLCDPQKLDFSNISRHEGDLLDVDKYKTQVVAERVYKINPSIRVETYAENIFDRPLDQVRNICKVDLMVGATDKRSIQLLLSHLAHKYKIPCVFGGCFEEARGGEVFFMLPGMNMPCLACLRDGLEQPPENKRIDYSVAQSPDDYQGQPGLHSAVTLITCIEVLFCLGILLLDSTTSQLAKLIDPKRNFILIGGALGTGFYKFKKPFDIFFQPLSGPRKTCTVCQKPINTNYGDK